MISQAEIDQIWKLWKQGVNQSNISKALNKSHGSIHAVLSKNGGIYRPPRTRSELHLSIEEREDICIGLHRGESLRSIAKRLSRSPSTISREVSRNGGREHYRAFKADHRARSMRCRPKPCKLRLNRDLRLIVSDKLDQYWSPE